MITTIITAHRPELARVISDRDERDVPIQLTESRFGAHMEAARHMAQWAYPEELTRGHLTLVKVEMTADGEIRHWEIEE